ncbi:MAG: plastocyanin/azurin family copper-binding protein [Longimicrobiales bacterium]
MRRGTGTRCIALAGVLLAVGWPSYGQLTPRSPSYGQLTTGSPSYGPVPSSAPRGSIGERVTPAYRADPGTPADTTILIHTSGTNLEFMPSRISAKQGTRVTVRYVNEGTLPHNFVVVKAEDDIATLGRAAFKAQDTDYVPLEHESLMIAHSELATPGETVEVTFEMPPAGEYFFVCLYSGHYNMMVGTLRSLK